MSLIAVVDWPYTLVLWTIRVSLLCSSVALFLLIGKADSNGLQKAPNVRAARTWWSLGLAMYVIHVFLAFQVVHHWSHAEAVHHTADKSAAVVGIRFGGGIYFNHLLTVLWLADVVWWWAGPVSHADRPRWLTVGWYAFFLFIAVNATIIFENGPIRWFGIAAVAALAFRHGLRAKKRRTGQRPFPQSRRVE